MEPLPVRPTTIPQARRYTRTFQALGNRTFTEDDNIIIDIPPIQQTYLTKDARIFFTFDMEFNVTQELSSYNKNTSMPNSNLNVVQKPLPMLDVCGPYGFIRALEVYDYLGNTLIEKIDRHDLMASILSDFFLDNEVDRLRPYIYENQTVSSDLEWFNYTDEQTTPISTFSQVYYHDVNRDFGLPAVQTRVNGINLLDPDRSSLGQQSFTELSNNATYTDYVRSAISGTGTTYIVPRWVFSIQLLNFMGRMSEKFVPLHNGFRIVLKTNKSTVPVKFSLPNGGLNMPYYNSVNGKIVTVPIIPSITKFNFSDVYLRADLLEISRELDDQVDKLIHAKMTQYYQLGRLDVPTILPGNFLSLTNVKLSMRHLPINSSHSELGFRSSTDVTSCRLFLNDAVVTEYKTPTEIFNALGPDFDPSINQLSFLTTRPATTGFGTGGYMYPYLSRDFKYSLAQLRPYVKTVSSLNWLNFESDFVNQTANFNEMFFRFNVNSGKFLINFPLTLNGYTSNQITGIDTTKSKLKVQLNRSLSSDKYAWVTDVFCEFDAIITIVPGKSTSVSF